MIIAARLWMEGKWDKAGVVWDQILAEHPRDALAIQCAHLTDFLTGDATNLRDRISRVLGHWDENVPGYSYILGMQAFGLEECNHFEQAEETAMKALSIEPRDGWSVHAIAHVMEMQNRYKEGQQFLKSRSDDWSPKTVSLFTTGGIVRFFISNRRISRVLFRSMIGEIILEDSDVSMQMLDTSALLWRFTFTRHRPG